MNKATKNKTPFEHTVVLTWALSVFFLISCNGKSSFERFGKISPLNQSLNGDGPEAQTLAHEITQFIFQNNHPLSANYFQNMKAADLNNDGSLDLILTETNESKISLLVNDGSGGFSLLKSLDTSGKVYSRILTDDLNNDGKYDICVTSYGGVVNIWLNDGANNFNSRIDIPTTTGGGAVNFISSGDINNDGLVDVVVANTINNNLGSLALLINKGTPVLSFDQTELAVGLAPYGVVLSDLNNDGLDDLTLTSRTDDKIYILKNVAGVFSPHSNFVASLDPASSKLTDIISADFNNDGVMDVAWGTECTLGKIPCHKDNYSQHIYMAFSDTSLSLGAVENLETKAYGDVRMLQAYDVNLDGHLDIISIDDINTFPFSGQGEYSSLSIFINDKNESFHDVQNKMLVEERDAGGVVVTPGSSYSNSFAFGDFNNDGLSDFFADAKLNSAHLSSGVRLYFGKKP